MSAPRLWISILACVLLVNLSACRKVQTSASIDCAASSLALQQLEPTVQHVEGDELHQYWLLENLPELWQPPSAELEPLANYRARVREDLPDTGALAFIRANRERNSWLEREYPAEREINWRIESGVGTHRSMNCLESHILAFQAARFPLYEQPSEILAAMLLFSDETSDQLEVHIAADSDAVLPKPRWALQAIEERLAQGWRFYGVFHNHTFNHGKDRSLIPVAAPSANDLEISVALVDSHRLENIFVTDGFNTLELTAGEIRDLARSALSIREAAD